MSSSTTISIKVTHRGKLYPLSLLPDSTLADLQARLEELTSVPPSLQKLLYKGKKAGGDDGDITLTDAGLKDGVKVQLLGSTMNELGDMRAAEDGQQKRERILRERALKPSAKVRTTGTQSMSDLSYRFHRVEPLADPPTPPSLFAVLERLAADPAVAHVMRTHRFSVALLTELSPFQRQELHGVNTGSGAQIEVRLRTLVGGGLYKPYSEVRETLLHELAHNVHGHHEQPFVDLNMQLRREVAQYEAAVKAGTHSLQTGEVYQPQSSSEGGSSSRGNVLGGGGPDLSGLSPEERRRRALDATMKRLQKD
ncbi:hypothetical protein PLICRDRAFT_44509 [Plicaturopsis crispa FD-325 SS-3]|nr:hypothetical protein PLICRDRAFT_44509 [Plicaturopsis crispa FD-325 SS-3]